jgi:hypothetical protein
MRVAEEAGGRVIIEDGTGSLSSAPDGNFSSSAIITNSVSQIGHLSHACIINTLYPRLLPPSSFFC